MFFTYQKQFWIILDLVNDNNTAKEQWFSDFIKLLQMVYIFISKKYVLKKLKIDIHPRGWAIVKVDLNFTQNHYKPIIQCLVTIRWYFLCFTWKALI